jgi:large subunit ribosomal protein L10
MARDKAARNLEADDLGKYWQESSLAVCAEYHGLSVKQIMDLRKQLRAVGAKCKVVKNTLARLGVDRGLGSNDPQQVAKLKDMLVGPSFLVFANEDVVGPAKVLAKFSKDNEVFKLKGGWYEGSAVDKSAVAQIASLPSREELYAKLLYLLNAPATQLARVINASGQQVVTALNAYKEKLSA